MPRKACRIILEITGHRLEKLLDISEEDAKAEGVEIGYGGNYVDYVSPETVNMFARNSFLSLWEKINGAESRFDNPWVWVISFKKI